MEKMNGRQITSGLFWTFGERITAQLVTTIVGIVLARILSPDDYGIVSIVMVIITFCNVFVTAGFGSAVVQKKEADDLDFNTAFVISLIVSIILYLLIFITSPIIASFYNIPLLSPVLRVLGVRIIITSINTIQQAYIRRQMQFKKFFIATLFGTVVSCCAGVIMAYRGFGVWALVAQYLTNTIIDTFVLLVVGEWTPRLQFELDRAKTIFSFGWKVLCTQLVFTLEGDIRSLIIGKVFGSADLAYYDNGKKYPSLIVTNINSSINKVMLPAYSKCQDNIEALKEMLRKSIRAGVYFMAPILIGFAVVSNNFVSVILTDKWRSTIPFIQIFCIMYLTRPLEETCHQSILALGRSDIALIIMILIHSTSLIMTIIAVFVLKSVLFVAIFSLINALVSIISFMIATNRLIGYKYQEQISDLVPSIVLAIIMGILVWCVDFIDIGKMWKLAIQIIVGIISYFMLSIVFRNKTFHYILDKYLKRNGRRSE